MHDDVFDNIIKQYYQSIYNFCRVKLRDEHAAHDCTQEVFLTFFRKRNELEISEKTRAWLYKAADNFIKNYIRKNRNDISIDEFDSSLSVFPEYLNDYHILDGILTEDEEKLLTAYYLDRTDIKSLSVMMNRSEAALYKRLQRIKNKIIRHLQKKTKICRKDDSYET